MSSTASNSTSALLNQNQRQPYVLPLIDEASIDEGLNGVSLVFRVPPQSGHRAKRIAIVDYGEDFNGKPLRREAPGMGSVEGRIGPRGINYVAG